MNKQKAMVVTLLLALMFILILPTVSSAQEDMEKTETDYGQLSLKIGKTYTVPKITTNSNTLTPKEGYKIIVVELEGTAPQAMDIKLKTGDCSIQSGDTKTSSSAVGIGITKELQDIMHSKEKFMWGVAGSVAAGNSIKTALKCHSRNRSTSLWRSVFLWNEMHLISM